MNTNAIPLTPQLSRSARIDMLRGVAVFGILLVNVWSFVWGFESLRYGVLPVSASIGDRAAVFATAFLAEQKFYPIFAFLFGAGFALHTRALKRMHGDWDRVKKIYRRRLGWLLGCGVLHGTLIWFGDILTVYGIAGFCILGLAGARLKTVRRGLWLWCAVWIALVAWNVMSALPMAGGADAARLWSGMVQQSEAARAVYTDGTVLGIGLRRVADYAASTSQSVYLLPHIMLLFLLGIVSVRLGWLTRPGRHGALWRRVRAFGFGIGIPFNLVWASVTLAQAGNPLQPPSHVFAVYALLPVGGSCLAAAYVASMMLARADTVRRVEPWLAPVGRMALTNYLAQSVLCTLLLQGHGLALGAALPPAALPALAAAIMLLQIFASRWWLARNRQGPVEAVYRRHADGAAVRS